MTLFSIIFERKVVGRMQNRIGPNRVGPWGLLQSLADGLKLAFKEEIIPVLADKPVYFLAPIISAVPAFLAFCVIPFGPQVSMFGHHTALQLTDLPVGVLVVFACSSLGVYGIVLAGWASGSTYPLLGGLRSAAQMISYEVAMGLSMVAVFLFSGTMSTSGIVAFQHHHPWNAIPLFVSFAIYAIAVVGETNRAPFDLAEAESELVGGFQTEYSSFKFAMFYLAEYINMVTVSALATTLFLGGWRAPWPISLWHGANSGWWPILWFTAKVIVGIFIFVWLRGTLAAAALRPVHGLRLEGAHPDQPGVDPRHHRGAGAARSWLGMVAGDRRPRLGHPAPGRRARPDGLGRNAGPPGRRPGRGRRGRRRRGTDLPGAADGSRRPDASAHADRRPP